MKKGFTLLELLAVIGIIGMLALIIIPSTVKILNSSIDNTMKLQETEVENAAKLYIEDYCKTPISTTHICTLTKTISGSGIAVYSGTIDLNVLISDDYIDPISIRSANCIGRVVYSDSVPEAYLTCGTIYTTDGY